jgi:hypothetical protein
MNGFDVHASGEVEITRSDLDARAESLYANRDPARRSLRLMRKPVLVGRGDNTFRLSGRRIDVDAGTDRELKRVVAFGEGKLEGTQLDLAGDTVDLSFDKRVITAARATGDSGAFMKSQQHTMAGRTLDITMALGRLAQLKASGNGRAELAPDSALTDSTLKNFVEGDTVVIGFEPVVRARRAADSTARTDTVAGVSPPPAARPDTTVAPRSIVASGNARMLFQRVQERAEPGCSVVDYWVGRQISVTVQGGQIKNMKIVGGARGLNSGCAPPAGQAARIPPP